MQEIKVAAVSTKNWIGEPDRSIKNMSRWAREAAEEGAELVVFPELGVNGFVHHEIVWDIAEPVPGPSTDKLIAIAGDLGIVVCFGILERDADITYNTQVLVNGDGVIGKQRKIHIPGREYMHWRSGFEVEVFDIGKAKVGITICYDSLFPELARSLYLKGAEILIMPFAYNTGPRSRFPEEEITGMCYRSTCFLNGCYGIICNNAGTRKKNQYEPEGMRFPGWAGVISPRGDVLDFTRDKGNGQAISITMLDPEVLAARRRHAYFTPRYLRPEAYTHIDSIYNTHER